MFTDCTRFYCCCNHTAMRCKFCSGMFFSYSSLQDVGSFPKELFARLKITQDNQKQRLDLSQVKA